MFLRSWGTIQTCSPCCPCTHAPTLLLLLDASASSLMPRCSALSTSPVCPTLQRLHAEPPRGGSVYQPKTPTADAPRSGRTSRQRPTSRHCCARPQATTASGPSSTAAVDSPRHGREIDRRCCSQSVAAGDALWANQVSYGRLHLLI